MITVELRPSTRLVQLIASIERFAGRWERLAEITQIASAESQEAAIIEQTAAAFLLDSTTPSHISLALQKGWNRGALAKAALLRGALERGPAALPAEAAHPLISAYRGAHINFAELGRQSIEQLYLELAGVGDRNAFDGRALPDGTVIEAGPEFYRTTPANFTLPGIYTDSEELVFQTVPPFLVRQRFEDLLEWLNRELEAGDYHPLFLFGTFHLLFMQTMPFGRGDHRLSLNILWRLMNGHSYSFVQHTSFASILFSRSKGYLQALRQAEKTVFTTWSTLNIWLEFFLEALVLAANNLSDLVEKGVEEQRLTRTQRNIIEIVRSRGPVTRETIVTESGINLSTVKYNLSVLSARGYLKRTGGGRTTSYWVS